MSAVRWREWGVLLFALLLPSLETWLYFVALAGRPNEDNPTMRLVFTLGKIVQFGFPVVYVWLLGELLTPHPQPLSPSTGRGENEARRGTFLLALVFGLLTFGAILGLYHSVLKGSPLLTATSAQIWQKVQEFGCATSAQFLLLALFISVPHAFLEEYYWRWFVFGRLRRLLPLTPAIVISSLGFMAHHVILLAFYFPGEWLTIIIPFSLGLAVGGAVWAWLYERSRSLVGLWLSHLLADAAIMLVGYDMVAARLAG